MITTDYRARRYLVRTALESWAMNLGHPDNATHSRECPACGAMLHLKRTHTRTGNYHSARCESLACVELLM